MTEHDQTRLEVEVAVLREQRDAYETAVDAYETVIAARDNLIAAQDRLIDQLRQAWTALNAELERELRPTLQIYPKPEVVKA